MAKTILLIPTTFLMLWLSVEGKFNFPLTKVDKPTIEKSIVEDSSFNETATIPSLNKESCQEVFLNTASKLNRFKIGDLRLAVSDFSEDSLDIEVATDGVFRNGGGSQYKVKTIVIDAGHGGRDGGCSGSHSLEKEINLKIAKKVKAEIERKFPKMTVIMTRDKDVFIPLHKRAKIANENEADLFLSIHCNAIRSTKHIHGSETYVLGLHNAERNLEVAKRENDVVFMEEDYEQNYGFDPNSPAGHIMMSAFQNSNLEQSILFAEKIETHIKLQTPHRSRGVKQAGFHVLREVSMPSVLLETGYLTSKKDEEFLSNEQGQNYIASAIVNALSDFKSQVETGIQQVVPQRQFANNPRPTPKKLNLKPQKKVVIQKKEQPTIRPQIRKEERLVAKSVEKPAPNVIFKKEEPVASATTKKSVATNVPTTKKLIPEPKVNSSYIRVIEEEPVAQQPEVEFKIQIAASRTPIEVYNPKLIRGGYIVKTVEESGMLKYQTGISQNFKKAIEKLNFVKKAGYKDAFIVAYNRGRKIGIPEAKRLTQ